MADYKSSFVFTNEGRTLLVSQTGGIKFAILGYMLVGGLVRALEGDDNIAQDAVAKRETGDTSPDAALRRTWKSLEDKAFNAKLSPIEYLMENDKITLFMKGVNYEINGNDILPSSKEAYAEAAQNYKEHLFGSFYIPSTEIKTVPNQSRYGTYAFNFDKTYLNCDIKKDVSIRHVILIGKQYAENKEATFNVSQRQDASIVGIAEIIQEDTKNNSEEQTETLYNTPENEESSSSNDVPPGIELLKDQNEFVTFQCQLRFTVTECPNEFIDINNGDKVVIDDTEDKDATKPAYEPVSDIASKLALVNNGLKTLSGGITIGQTEEVLDELQLGPEGSICMTKTLMVADCIDADDAENQFNAAALIHPINKYPEEGKEYVPQILMTSVHSTSALNEDITAYSVGMTVKAEGRGEAYSMFPDSITSADAPIFKLGHIPENDRIAVDIFGLDNKLNGVAKDRLIFSEFNRLTDSHYGRPDVLFNSNSNIMREGASNNNNTLYNSDSNELSQGASNALLFESNGNNFSGGNGNSLYGSVANNIMYGNYNKLLFSDANTVRSHNHTFINSNANTAVENSNNFIAIASYGNGFSGNSYENVLIKSKGNSFSGQAFNSLIMGSVSNQLFEDTKEATLLNAKNVTLRSSYDDMILGSRGGLLYKSYFNGYYDNYTCTVSESDQNSLMRSRFLGLKGMPIGSIDPAERPIKSDVQSNNNVILRGEYFDMFMCSNNFIVDTYKLQSDDNITSLGPVRVKGSTVINSSKSKIFNARDIYLWHSEYSRVVAASNLSDSVLGLVGTSNSMGSTNELDSIYYGEFYGSDFSIKGLKGASYKNGAESIKTNARPVDMLRLKLMFMNTFGSELDLGGYNRDIKYKRSTSYLANAPFESQNFTLFNTSIKPTNSNVVGGHHNKFIGGKNTVILGGEYCKASTYEHQVLMGKYNKDVPADIIYGCGHFNGTTFVQGDKEYTESELETIETMHQTIDRVRGDGDNKSGETCFNALEFYAHQGKMIFRNCDDGHDAGSDVVSNNFGKSVTIDPTGIIFRDRNGDITGELVPQAVNSDGGKWTITLDIDTNGRYYVANTVGMPTTLSQLDKVVLANHLFEYVDLNNYTGNQGMQFSAASYGNLSEDAVSASNNTLFGKQIPSEINILIKKLKYNSEPGTSLRHDWVFVNKIMPWYRYNGQAPRYIPMQTCTLKYYYVGPNPSASTYTQAMTIWAPPSMDASCICKKIDYTYSAYMATDHWSTRKRGCIPLDEFNDNKFFSDWVPNVPVYEGTAPSAGGVEPIYNTSGNFVSGGLTQAPGEITLYRANEIPTIGSMDPNGYYII